MGLSLRDKPCLVSVDKLGKDLLRLSWQELTCIACNQCIGNSDIVLVYDSPVCLFPETDWKVVSGQ